MWHGWTNYAKGIGIMLVVVGHTIRGLRPEVVGPTLDTYLALDPWIYSFHMPLFFCLSGLLLPRRLETSSWGKFFRSLLLGIVLPYTIWSVAFVLIQNASPYPVNLRQTPERLLTIWRAPILHMWFLYALLFVQIAYFAAWRMFKVFGSSRDSLTSDNEIAMKKLVETYRRHLRKFDKM